MIRPIQDLTLQFNGFPIRRAQEELARIHQMPLKDILLHGEHGGWEIFRFHCVHNKTYFHFADRKDFRGWDSVPIMPKEYYQRPLSLLLSNGFTKNNVYVQSTSGSSGTPMFFAKNKFCHALTWAIIYNRFGWHDIRPGTDLQARFYGIASSGRNYYKEKLKDIISRRVRFPVFDLSDGGLERFLKTFERHRFIYINGYTSPLVLFAKYLLKKNLVLTEICNSLKKVFITSETSDETDRKLLKKAFGVDIVNEYGASELDLIAFEDQQGDFLVNYESLLVEILDDNNRPVPPGHEGRVIVTSIYNRAMPFIRYDLGDRAVLTDQMKNGYPVLQKVTGRTNDIVILPSGKKAPGLTFYYIAKSLLEEGNFMKEFTIHQTSPVHFHFNYVAHRDLEEYEKNAVLEAMFKYLEPGLTASFERKDKLERNAAGKLRHFSSGLQPASIYNG